MEGVVSRQSGPAPPIAHRWRLQQPPGILTGEAGNEVKTEGHVYYESASEIPGAEPQDESLNHCKQ